MNRADYMYKVYETLLIKGEQQRRLKRELLKFLGKEEILLDQEKLNLYYNDLRKIQMKRHPELFDVTSYENQFNEIVLLNSNLNPYRTVLIGRSTVDFFFPNLKGELSFSSERDGELGVQKGFSGVCIEIDGPIHSYKEAKIKTDEWKMGYLDEKMNFLFHGIQNEDITESKISHYCSELKNCKIASDYEALKNWNRVKLFTVANLGNHKHFWSLLGINDVKTYENFNREAQNAIGSAYL